MLKSKIKSFLRPYYHDIKKYLYFRKIDRSLIRSDQIIPKTLLLIRLDAIGDYILFRNFIQSIRTSKKYHDYKITLVGNLAWKDLAEFLDTQLIDQFTWIDRKLFDTEMDYRSQKLAEIAHQGYEIVLHPVFSREFFYGDWIVNLVKSRKKIGYHGDFSNIKPWQKLIGNFFYSTLINNIGKIKFEFERNKDFFEAITSERIPIKKPYINIHQFEHLPIPPFSIPSFNYAVIFIGGSAESRKWSQGGFVDVANHLHLDHNLEIILAGGPNDQKLAYEIEKSLKFKCYNLAGRTNLIELLCLLNGAKLLLSNETGAVHMAVALNVPKIFVISNGNHLNRFCPYPSNIGANYQAIFHPRILENYDRYVIQGNRPGPKNLPPISEISSASCIKYLKKSAN